MKNDFPLFFTAMSEIRRLRAVVSAMTDTNHEDSSYIIKFVEHSDSIELLLRDRIEGKPASVVITHDWSLTAELWERNDGDIHPRAAEYLDDVNTIMKTLETLCDIPNEYTIEALHLSNENSVRENISIRAGRYPVVGYIHYTGGGFTVPFNICLDLITRAHEKLNIEIVLDYDDE